MKTLKTKINESDASVRHFDPSKQIHVVTLQKRAGCVLRNIATVELNAEEVRTAGGRDFITKAAKAKALAAA